MSVEGALARGRAAALQLMRDQCTIERHTGRTFDDDTGLYADVWAEVYTGACRVRLGGSTRGGGAARETDLEVQTVTLQRGQLDLPWDTTAEIHPDDRVTVTSSDDTWLIGRHLRVIAAGLSGSTTARRIAIEDRS